MNPIAMLLRTPAGLDELEVLRVSDPNTVDAMAFKELMPSPVRRNLRRLECNDGEMYQVELFEGGKWKEYKYLVLYFRTEERVPRLCV